MADYWTPVLAELERRLTESQPDAPLPAVKLNRAATANEEGRMSRALVTWARGQEHLQLLDISLPSMEAFADRHGYDVVIPEIDSTRPASWCKVPALHAALEDYDEALWVDADVVITDPTADMHVPDGCWQALVEHHTGDGDVPNCGVWFVRKPMAPILEAMWGMTQHLNHGWWEQAAMLELLGYEDMRSRGIPTHLVQPSELYRRTFWLDNGWNVHPWDDRADRPRFMHASMHADRESVMREWADLAVAA